MDSVWDHYHDVAGDTPNPLTVGVLSCHTGKRLAAFDLGAGNMRDAKYLLKQGFCTVTAVDMSVGCLPYVTTNILFERIAIQDWKPLPRSFDFGISCNTFFYLSPK